MDVQPSKGERGSQAADHGRKKRCWSMVEIKLDRDKFEERVEEIMKNSIIRAYDLKAEQTDPWNEAIDDPSISR